MFDDPWYGLNNPENYERWQAFRTESASDTREGNRRLAWAVELQFYFGLSRAQIEELEPNWLNLFDTVNSAVKATIPSVPLYQDAIGYGYWQWASSYWTQPEPSVTDLGVNIANSIAGIPEINSWKISVLDMGACGS